MARLEHTPELTGHFSHDGKRYRVEDGIISGVDPEIAEEMAAHPRITLLSTSDTAEICGTEMSEGDICERPADSCPYHD